MDTIIAGVLPFWLSPFIALFLVVIWLMRRRRKRRHSGPIPNWFERNYYGANQMSPKVNRVGPSGARIMHVGQRRIEYINMAGQELFIDLEECARNWVRWVGGHEDEFMAVPGSSEADVAAYDARCVCLRGGRRDAYWAEFMDEQKTRFEFESFEAYWNELQAPLTVAGWCTFDTA